MNTLFCALDKNEFNHVSIYDSAFDIWRTLEVTHEGTSWVKESKFNILVHSYELFRMKPSESIGDMYTRFTDVINGLKAYGKCFSNFELVTKILRSLPKNRKDMTLTSQEDHLKGTSSDEDSDNDIALLTKKIKKIFQKE